MRRYKVNARFGPWKAGDIFESDDPLHEAMSEEGIYLLYIEDAKTIEPTFEEIPVVELEPADESPAEEPAPTTNEE